MKTVVIGMGNPILSDDGVGIAVVRELKKEFGKEVAVDVIELCAGGLRLMEAMVGYEAAVIVDATVSSNALPGTIREGACQGWPLPPSLNILSTHDGSLTAALAAGRQLDLALPQTIRIMTIEADDIRTFAEQLSPAVASAVPKAVKRIREWVDEWNVQL